MEIATVANKLGKPSFMIGATFLIGIGAYIASSKSMTIGLKGSTQKDIPVYGRVLIGLFIMFIGFMLGYKAVKYSESAS